MAQNIHQAFNSWKRKESRKAGQTSPTESSPAHRFPGRLLPCVLCLSQGANTEVEESVAAFTTHLEQVHGDVLQSQSGASREELVLEYLQQSATTEKAGGESRGGRAIRDGDELGVRRQSSGSRGLNAPSGAPDAYGLPDQRPSSTHAHGYSQSQGATSPLSLDAQRQSPTLSLKRQPTSRSPPRRSRARVADQSSAAEFTPRPPSKGTLWMPEQPAPPSRQSSRYPPGKDAHGKAHRPHPPFPATTEDNVEDLIKQPETRPISQEQLVAEVKGIYAGLVMVESKCIEVDNAQSSQSDSSTKLNNEQWQALIALHRTLLHEHHDFFLASQHPSASLALRRLASKYSMPARMWRHGIHSFLELLRHRLPASLEHMLTFIYLAYSMMALLFETVPAFEETWIECLGDLGRYRMAIEDDKEDRDVWTAVSRHWYSKASDRAPTTGRLYHHLAILARPNALQQMFYYSKSLCVPVPFVSARESITTLFEPVLKTSSGQNSRLQPVDAAFIRIHAILFTRTHVEKLESSLDEFIGQLDNHIGRTTKNWIEPAYYIAIANACALVDYGNKNNVISRVITPRHHDDREDHLMEGSEPAEDGPDMFFEKALELNCRTHNVVMRRYGDPNVSPYLHVSLAFIFRLTAAPNAMQYVERKFPWKLISVMLNTLGNTMESFTRFVSSEFLRPVRGELPRPLPEDYAMRGLIWAEDYFPSDWFSNDKIDDDEKYFELASMAEERKDRCLWLGCQIAKQSDYLLFDAASRQFSVPAEFDTNIDEQPAVEDAMDAEAPSRVPTFASATSAGGRTSTWATVKDEDEAMDTDNVIPTILR